MLTNVKLVHIFVARRHIATTQMVLTDVCVALAGPGPGIIAKVNRIVGFLVGFGKSSDQCLGVE